MEGTGTPVTQQQLTAMLMECTQAIQQMCQNFEKTMQDLALTLKRLQRPNKWNRLHTLSCAKDLVIWDLQLRADLGRCGWLDYIDKDNELTDKESPEWQAWKENCEDIFLHMESSFRTNRNPMWIMLVLRGWNPQDPKHRTPRSTYLKIHQALQPHSRDQALNVVHDYFTAFPCDFDSLDPWLNHLFFLDRRIKILKLTPEEIEMWSVMARLKASVPDIYDKASRRMEGKEIKDTGELMAAVAQAAKCSGSAPLD
ncbi:hypothetical protein VTK56DRAFT_9522 [Thermocarpiscus australiensis]